MGQDKDGKITYWLLSRAKQSRLGENSFIANLYIYIKLLIWVLRNKERIKTLRENTLLLLSQARLRSRPPSYLLIITAGYTWSHQ